jgi:hypothetical protein
MIRVETTTPPAFDVVVVKSLRHFFRDQLQPEFYACRFPPRNGHPGASQILMGPASRPSICRPILRGLHHRCVQM